jgi:hypothetical protein
MIILAGNGLGSQDFFMLLVSFFRLVNNLWNATSETQPRLAVEARLLFRKILTVMEFKPNMFFMIQIVEHDLPETYKKIKMKIMLICS